MALIDFVVNDAAHNSDGLLLHAWDGPERVTAFIGRSVMDDWVDPGQSFGKRKSLFRAEYNALGNSNIAAINRIASSKYRRGATFNRQHPFVGILLADITESGEVLDLTVLNREAKSTRASA
jgi:hypothetical protein